MIYNPVGKVKFVAYHIWNKIPEDANHMNLYNAMAISKIDSFSHVVLNKSVTDGIEY